jgi:hypothetical protein
LSRRKKRTKQQDPSKRENSYSSQKRKRKSHSENTLSEYVPTWLSTRTRTASSAKRKGQDTQQSHSQTKINESIIEISSESDKEVFSLDNKNEGTLHLSCFLFMTSELQRSMINFKYSDVYGRL